MLKRSRSLVWLLGLAAAANVVSCGSAMPKPQSIMGSMVSTNKEEPPPVMREFRAAWVATVANIDWPSKPGLSTEEQQKEILSTLDTAKRMNLNAIVLQVRTTGDAFYDSNLEPWSYYLTGQQGKAPEPFYDPLKFWIDESHRRGLELHAWLNPYRTRIAGSPVVESPTHLAKTHPELVKTYGKSAWMDPGEPAAQEHSFKVFMDVVERYDVDGIHMDDYFYPYPEKAPGEKENIRFPDEGSYGRYQGEGGKLKLDDWRRKSIDDFVQRTYEGIKKRKPTVQFGISPFGIPRPGLKGIEYVHGFDQYEALYADTVKWLENGWCDYIAPQLYWKMSLPSQPFLGLLQFWTANNPKGRHVYAGQYTSRINEKAESWQPDEILGQIMTTRLTPGAGGEIHFSMKALTQNRKKITDILADGPYAKQALVPASPWLKSTVPTGPSEVRVTPALPPMPKPPAKDETNAASKPSVAKAEKVGPTTVTWTPAGGEAATMWVVQWKVGDEWKSQILTGEHREATLPAGPPISVVSVSAVDRASNQSKPNVVRAPVEK